MIQNSTPTKDSDIYIKAEQYYFDFNLVDAPLGMHFQVVTTYIAGYLQALYDLGYLKPLSDE